ncbi:apolipoprotein D-like [Colias croceus]|uniref:apolipoprotein D-like n=1 Tax=Colias crocea TaxID=72248 RepID=UPI001E27AD99|nr:apolipoprotein D-like [Colias croceus]
MGDFRVTGAARIYLVLFCTIVQAVCVSTGLGKCPIYPQFPNFDMTRMSGKWYEVERSFHLIEIAASCTEIDVTINERGYFVINVHTINRLTGNHGVSYGLGIPSHAGSSAFRYKLNNRMPYVIGRMLPGAGHYNILFTDYDQFALIWSCTNYNVVHSDRIWLLGRERDIDAILRAQIYAIMQELNLDSDRLIISKNNNCTAVPYNNDIQ